MFHFFLHLFFVSKKFGNKLFGTNAKKLIKQIKIFYNLYDCKFFYVFLLNKNKSKLDKNKKIYNINN